MNRVLALLMFSPGLLFAQQPAAVTFTYENPALTPARYTITVLEDGTGRYRRDDGPQPTDRAIQLPEAMRKQIFTVARKNHLFAADCDSGHKNVAFTGTKTFSYKGPEGLGSCSFNYAKNQQVALAADNLIAVATTLEEGRKLELLLAHDKLGLNAEMDALTGEQEGARAQALGNIAPVLRAIVADPEVLDHTRKRAQTLLTASEK